MSRTGAAIISEQKKLSVFFSYARSDEKHKEDLERALAFLKRSEMVDTWYDRKILPGDNWENDINKHIDTADIILLLISPDFANSDYCWDVETKRALERGRRGEALVIPIIIRPVSGWQGTPIGRLQALPKGGKAVTTWRNRDEAYQNIADTLWLLVNNWSNQVTSASDILTRWSMKLEGTLEEYPESRIDSIALKLRKAANSLDLNLVGISNGSVAFNFESPECDFERLNNLHAAGLLENKIDTVILDLTVDPGAVLRIESRIVGNIYESTIRYLPRIFGERTLDEGFPPIVGAQFDFGVDFNQHA